MATEKITIVQELVVLYTSHLHVLYVENGQFNFAFFISLMEIVLCKCPFSLNEWIEEFCVNINNIMSRKINFKSREMTLD